MSWVLIDINRWQEAIQLIEDNIQYYSEYNNTYTLCELYNRKGFALETGHQPYEAIKSFNISKDIARANNLQIQMALSSSNIAVVYTDLQQYHLGLIELEKQLPTLETFERVRNIVPFVKSYAILLYRMGQVSKSIEQFKKALEVNNGMFLILETSCRTWLSRIYFELGQIEQSKEQRALSTIELNENYFGEMSWILYNYWWVGEQLEQPSTYINEIFLKLLLENPLDHPEFNIFLSSLEPQE